jgi:enamine deaminase RidA (YjgF/YER057c/UK114 family)
MSAEARLKQLGIIPPDLPAPKGTYLPRTFHNGVMYLSGQDPILENGDLACEIVGRDFTLEQANGHARRTGLVLLSAARSILDSLGRVEHVLNVFGMVNAAADFIEHLARVPAGWNHPAEKDSRQINMLEHVPTAKPLHTLAGHALKVVNGCSGLMVEVFSEAGRHARAAVGMGTLPGRISVEITAILAVKS